MLRASRGDIVVVGGGQAGLALGRELALRGTDFLIVDAGASPGRSWRARWDSLRLFTPAAYSALPGLPFPGPPEALPTKEQVADYLAAYYAHFALPIRWNAPVRRLARGDPGSGARYAVDTPTEVLTADHVVVATGPFQTPWRPSAATQLDESVYQVHAAGYRNPGQLPEGPALVVGSGNSGVQIADEIARTRPTTLACGRRQPYLPQRIAGRSAFWWGTRLRLMTTTRGSVMGRLLRRRGEPLVGNSPSRLRRQGVSLTGRVIAAAGDTLHTADGRTHRPRAVVWATGYAPDFSWVDLPVLDCHGRIRQRDGITELPGLYTLGMVWQRINGSALLGWIGHDAAYLADIIVANPPSRGSSLRSSPHAGLNWR